MSSALRRTVIPTLREVRVHLCQMCASSRGAREFLELNYSQMKQAHPGVPVLVRESLGVQPKIFARYDFGEERSVILANLSKEDVLKAYTGLIPK